MPTNIYFSKSQKWAKDTYSVLPVSLKIKLIHCVGLGMVGY